MRGWASSRSAIKGLLVSLLGFLNRMDQRDLRPSLQLFEGNCHRNTGRDVFGLCATVKSVYRFPSFPIYTERKSGKACRRIIRCLYEEFAVLTLGCYKCKPLAG